MTLFGKLFQIFIVFWFCVLIVYAYYENNIHHTKIVLQILWAIVAILNISATICFTIALVYIYKCCGEIKMNFWKLIFLICFIWPVFIILIIHLSKRLEKKEQGLKQVGAITVF